MKETSIIKLSLFVVILFAFASCLSPFTAEARREQEFDPKRFHHHKRPHPVHPLPSPSQAPETSPTTPSNPPQQSEESSAPPPYDIGKDTPPSEFQGCGLPCRDSNDCYWSCPICCSNQTCCDQSIPNPSYTPSPAPLLAPPLPPSASPSLPPFQPPIDPPPTNGFRRDDNLPPNWPPPTDNGVPPGYVPMPYQVHGCGYPCDNSDDCDAPCTVCCGDGKNNSCCYDYDYPLPPF